MGPGDDKGFFGGFSDLVTALKNLVLSANTINQTLAATFPSWTSGQIPGAPSNGDALAGNIGEYMFSNIAIGSATALTTATAKTVTSLTLTPGDWDVWGTVGFTANVVTTATIFKGALNTATNTMPTSPGAGGSHEMTLGAGAGVLMPTFPVGSIRQTLAGNTPVYLIAESTFAVNTMSAFGFIAARRRR